MRNNNFKDILNIVRLLEFLKRLGVHFKIVDKDGLQTELRVSYFRSPIEYEEFHDAYHSLNNF